MVSSWEGTFLGSSIRAGSTPAVSLDGLVFSPVMKFCYNQVTITFRKYSIFHKHSSNDLYKSSVEVLILSKLLLYKSFDLRLGKMNYLSKLRSSLKNKMIITDAKSPIQYNMITDLLNRKKCKNRQIELQTSKKAAIIKSFSKARRRVGVY